MKLSSYGLAGLFGTLLLLGGCTTDEPNAPALSEGMNT